MTTAKHEKQTNGVTDWERAEVERANTSGLSPVVFVHGLWLLPSSWGGWRKLFEDNGYITVAPGWPDDPRTREQAYANPGVFAGKSVQDVTDHYLAVISELTTKPAVIGHSFGGLIVQKIADDGAAAATVAIDNAPIKGVLPLPLSALKSGAPVLRNPANRHKAIALTFEQFQYGWANNLDEAEARQLYDTYHVPASGEPLFEAGFANFMLGGDTSVDVKNPNRGPLLIISGTNDTTAPRAFTHGSFKKQLKNPEVTEYVEIEGRGHSLILDHGWPDVANPALTFIKRFLWLEVCGARHAHWPVGKSRDVHRS
jgi:pimeloyl-ACP methyl ester carboxylesterase